jgi:hypothetical protein
MKNIDEFIKQISLVMTDTINRDELINVDFDLNNYEVNKEKSVNLLNILKNFNKLYLEFKKDQEKLEQLNLGSKVEVLKYTKGNNSRNMILNVEKPIMCEYNQIFICIYEKDNKMHCILTNYRQYGDKDYYNKIINIDKEVIQKYLDLFEKHIQFIELYYYFKNQMIFGNATTTLGLNIIGDQTQKTNKINIHLGNIYFNYEDCILIDAQLGEKFKINYDNCKIVLESNNLPIEHDVIDKLLNNTYINKKYLKQR